MELNFLPRINKFLFCMPLRVGALVVGYFSLLMSALFISGVSVSLYKVVQYVSSHKDQPAMDHTAEEMRAAAISLYITHAYFLLVLVFCCAISLMLVIGVHKSNPRWMRYYLVSALVLLAMNMVSVVLSFVFFGLFATLPSLKWCLVLFYFVIVVRSASLELADAHAQKPPPYTAVELQPLPAQSQHPLILN